MNLREVIEMLEAQDPSAVLAQGFGAADSWRGVYAEIAFEPACSVTVGSMLDHARAAVGATFTGYKGGEYRMGLDTLCHIARYGEYGGDEDELTHELLRFMLSTAVRKEPPTPRTEAAIADLERSHAAAIARARVEALLDAEKAIGRLTSSRGGGACAVSDVRHAAILEAKRVVRETRLAAPAPDEGDANDLAEAAFWRFDAKRKGYGQWKGMPMSERDAFKSELRAALARPAPDEGAEKAEACGTCGEYASDYGEHAPYCTPAPRILRAGEIPEKLLPGMVLQGPVAKWRVVTHVVMLDDGRNRLPWELEAARRWPLAEDFTCSAESAGGSDV